MHFYTYVMSFYNLVTLSHFISVPLNFNEFYKSKVSMYFSLANPCKICANCYEFT